MSNSEIIELQTNLFKAFNSANLDEVMSFFDDECVFEAIAGEDACGTKIVGAPSIRTAFKKVYETFPDVQWNISNVTTYGNEGGLAEWTFTGTQEDGKRVEANGVDLFSFSNGKIVKKNAFRKARPLLEPAV